MSSNIPFAVSGVIPSTSGGERFPVMDVPSVL